MSQSICFTYCLVESATNANSLNYKFIRMTKFKKKYLKKTKHLLLNHVSEEREKMCGNYFILLQSYSRFRNL